jgi:F0F1-type ATP synthase assembly protein I
MDTTGRPRGDLLDVVRVLLLVQGSILVATAIEALIWGMAFAAAGSSTLISAVAAAAVLVARARVRADRRWTRRLVYVIEGIVLTSLVIDMALAIAITHALPPAVALLTRLLLPLCVIALLRRTARATGAPVVSRPVASPEGAS